MPTFPKCKNFYMQMFVVLMKNVTFPWVKFKSSRLQTLCFTKPKKTIKKEPKRHHQQCISISLLVNSPTKTAKCHFQTEDFVISVRSVLYIFSILWFTCCPSSYFGGSDSLMLVMSDFGTVAVMG